VYAQRISKLWKIWVLYSKYPAAANRITKPRKLPEANFSGAPDFRVVLGMGLGAVRFAVE
jgi:hypothetical protein